MTLLSTTSHVLLILVSKVDIVRLSGSWKPYKVVGHATQQVSAACNLLAAHRATLRTAAPQGCPVLPSPATWDVGTAAPP